MMLNLPLNIDFSGKVAVVTGAGGVICGTMARAFAQCGAKVAALDLNEEAVKKLADELKAEGFICEGYSKNITITLWALDDIANILQGELKCLTRTSTSAQYLCTFHLLHIFL